MKQSLYSRFYGLLVLLLCAGPALAQSPAVGVWRTVDDNDGEPKSHVEIYEEDGRLYGRIVKLLPEGRLCDDCADEYNGKDLRGVVILRDLEPDGDSKWGGGSITDPKTGKNYRAKAEMDGPNRLRLRGFIGFSLLGRTQVWERVE